MRFDSLKTLQEKFPAVEKGQLQSIKKVVKEVPSFPTGKTVAEVLDEIDSLLGGHSVEVVRSPQGDPLCEYVNMGDVYNGTILFDHVSGRFYACDLGTQLEVYEKKGVEYY